MAFLHKGRCRYAWDFLMPIGTEIRASRTGKVVEVIDEHERRGLSKPNNEIYIEHEDGTRGRYCHIKRNSSKVKVGQMVNRVQVIALSGDVGKSLGPHLHFEVIDPSRNTIPVQFVDVDRHEGIPRATYFYTSRNADA